MSFQKPLLEGAAPGLPAPVLTGPHGREGCRGDSEVNIKRVAFRGSHSSWTFEGVTSDPPILSKASGASEHSSHRMGPQGGCSGQVVPAWPPPEEGFEETPSCTLPSFPPSPSTRLSSVPCHRDSDGRGQPQTRAPAGEPASIPLQPADQGSRGSRVPLSPPPMSISR